MRAWPMTPRQQGHLVVRAALEGGQIIVDVIDNGKACRARTGTGCWSPT